MPQLLVVTLLPQPLPQPQPHLQQLLLRQPLLLYLKALPLQPQPPPLQPLQLPLKFVKIFGHPAFAKSLRIGECVPIAL